MFCCSVCFGSLDEFVNKVKTSEDAKLPFSPGSVELISQISLSRLRQLRQSHLFSNLVSLREPAPVSRSQKPKFLSAASFGAHPSRNSHGVLPTRLVIRRIALYHTTTRGRHWDICFIPVLPYTAFRPTFPFATQSNRSILYNHVVFCEQEDKGEFVFVHPRDTARNQDHVRQVDYQYHRRHNDNVVFPETSSQ